MDQLFSLGFFMVGVACLWAVYTGRPFYPGRPGGSGSDRPRTPLGPRHGRIMWTLIGLGLLVTGVGSLIQQTFGWPPARHQ